LRGVHALKVLLEVLPREVRGERDDFLDTWQLLAHTLPCSEEPMTYEGPWCILGRHRRRMRTEYLRT
jgi:hypothetical protein